MPQPTLRLVAFGLGFACLGSFALALATAPAPGRLPGERSGSGSALILQAQDATPLVDERIEGAPAPEELTEEEKAALEAEKKAKEEALALAKAEAAKGAPAGPESVIAAPAVAPVAEKAAPPPPPPAPKVEEPVF